MPVGDIIWQSVKIGGLDLLAKDASFHGIDIYEDINDPFGSPLIEINVVDYSDALNKYKITGSYDENKIEVKFKYEPTGEIIGFNARMHSNKGLQDNMGGKNEGSGHSKTWQIRGAQEELFKANGTRVEKGFSGPTTKHVEKIFKDVIKSEKQFENRDDSQIRPKNYGRVHPVDAVNDLMQSHSSTRYESSAYTIFQEWKNGNPKIVQTTYEELFERAPVVTLKERTDLNSTGITEQDQQNSIMWAEYDPSWSQQRAMSKAVKKSFNNGTHTIVDENFKGHIKSKTPAFQNPPSYAEKYDVITSEDVMNNGKKHNTADAKRKKAQYFSHLLNGTAKIRIPGNPKVTLGSIVELDIPKKTDNNQFGGEGQFNKKALVVAIKHEIKPAGQKPQYTMVLELAKAGMEKGGTTA